MSKKIELFSRKKGKSTEPSNTQVGYQWSTQAYTLREILQKFKLPCVVKCNVSSCSLLWENFSFDMRQPLLLFSLRKVQKVFARTLQLDPDSSQYVQYGPAIVIPQDYPGWFSLASAEREGTPVHSNPEALVKHGVRSFLNTTHVAALQMQSSLEGAIKFTQRTLEPGEVFRVGKIYVGGVSEEKKWKIPVGKTTKEKQKEIKYLLCYDEKEWEILIPFGTNCRFYETSTENNNKPNGTSVVKMNDVLGTQKFPVLAQMIFGELPALMCYFTGSLHLLGKFEEETIVAATLGEEVNMMFEIGVSSSVRYNLALNENHIQNSDAYRRAVSMCESDLQSYVSNMKLAFTLKPELEELDDLNYDFYDLDSIPSYRADDTTSVHSTVSENLHVKSSENIQFVRPATSDLQTFRYDTVSI